MYNDHFDCVLVDKEGIMHCERGMFGAKAIEQIFKRYKDTSRKFVAIIFLKEQHDSLSNQVQNLDRNLIKEIKLI